MCSSGRLKKSLCPMACTILPLVTGLSAASPTAAPGSRIHDWIHGTLCFIEAAEDRRLRGQTLCSRSRQTRRPQALLFIKGRTFDQKARPLPTNLRHVDHSKSPGQPAGSLKHGSLLSGNLCASRANSQRKSICCGTLPRQTRPWLSTVAASPKRSALATDWIRDPLFPATNSRMRRPLIRWRSRATSSLPTPD